MKYPPETRAAVLAKYRQGGRTVRQIAAETGVSTTTAGTWISEIYPRNRAHDPRRPHRSLSLSLIEAEALIKLITVAEWDLEQDERAALHVIETRLIDIADDLRLQSGLKTLDN